MVFAVHNLFLYTMTLLGGVLAGVALAGKHEPIWKRLLSLGFLLSCVGIIFFAVIGM